MTLSFTRSNAAHLTIDTGPTHMNTYVILLRGVMPTGRNKVPMAPLRSALTEAGLGDVRTYIQSGNVIAMSALHHSELEQVVHAVIATTPLVRSGR